MTGAAPASARRPLILSTISFTLSFAAWGLIGGLASIFTGIYGLTASQTALLVAVPVLLGSLARLPMGMLTDRFGGRVIFTVLLGLAAIASWLVPLTTSYSGLIAAAFFLGLAGSSFAIGAAFVSRWAPAGRQGTMLGIYGLGTVGQSIAVFGGPVVERALGWPAVVLGLSGLALAAWRRRGVWLLVLLSFGCWWIGLGALRSLHAHYILPAVLPVALGLAGLAAELRRAAWARRRYVAAAVVFFAVLLIPLGAKGVREIRRYSRASTIREAKSFVMQELYRPEVCFACELGGPDLPRDPGADLSGRPVFERLDQLLPLDIAGLGGVQSGVGLPDDTAELPDGETMLITRP